MMEEAVVEQAPALPVKSGLRSSRFLEPIDSKAGLDDKQPPLSPATAPHEVYLSSEEDASSSADDFSDYDLDSDSELSSDSPIGRHSHEDTARVVSFIFYGKPSIVELPPRVKSAGSMGPQPVQRTSTDPFMSRRISVSSTTSTSILSTFSRSSTVMTGPSGRKPSFLSIDPYASKPESQRDGDRPPTPKGNGSMLRRTFSLARKRSKPALNKAAIESQDSLPLRPASVDPTEGPREQTITRKPKHQDIMQAARNSTTGAVPVAETETKASPKGHSRLRSGLSISMGRRKLEKVPPQ